jgi:hypothetical protein
MITTLDIGGLWSCFSWRHKSAIWTTLSASSFTQSPCSLESTSLMISPFSTYDFHAYSHCQHWLFKCTVKCKIFNKKSNGKTCKRKKSNCERSFETSVNAWFKEAQKHSRIDLRCTKTWRITDRKTDNQMFRNIAILEMFECDENLQCLRDSRYDADQCSFFHLSSQEPWAQNCMYHSSP